MILARSDIQSVGDLKGKTVAAEPGSLDMIHLSLALESAGLTKDDITLRPLPQNEMVQAFTLGQIDAAVTYPPTSIELLSNDNIDPIFDTVAYPER